MTAPPFWIAWKGDVDPGGRQCTDLRVSLGFRKPRRVQVLARVGRQWCGGLWNIAASTRCGRTGVHTSQDFRQAKLTGRMLCLLPRAPRPAECDFDRTGRTPLVDLRDALRTVQGDRKPCSRCLVRCARHRIRMRMDDHRQGLRQVSRADLARAILIPMAWWGNGYRVDVEGRLTPHCEPGCHDSIRGSPSAKRSVPNMGRRRRSGADPESKFEMGEIRQSTSQWTLSRRGNRPCGVALGSRIPRHTRRSSIP